MNATRSVKIDVAAAFSAAADTYDQSADAQREIAQRLAARIAKLELPERPRILEIGCGTGFLSRELHARLGAATWLITDISEKMLAACRHNFRGDARFAVMDGERPGCTGPFDLICSSLAFQWFDNLKGAAVRLSSLLAPGGHLFFATLAADSFKEWHTAYPDAGTFPGMATLRQIGEMDEERFTHNYPDALAFLNHWRQIGADVPRNGHKPLSPGALRRALRPFETGIQVTYHVAYGHIRR